MLNITFQQIAIFLEVARKLNITAVAEEMYVTQSAVSRSIARLENSIGCQLLERNRRGVKLTKDGKFLYDRLQASFGSICDAITELQCRGEEGARYIRIGFLSTIDSNKDYDKLNKFINDYKSSHPEIRFVESVHGFEELKNKLRYGELDVIFTPNFAIYDSDEVNIDSMSVLGFRLYVAVGMQNPARNFDSLNLDVLRKQPLYTMSYAGHSDAITAFLNEIGCAHANTIVVPNHDTLIRSLKNGNGFAVIGNQKMQDNSGVKLFTVTDTVHTITLHMAWRTDNSNMEVRRFVAAIAENKRKLSNF